MPELRAIEEDTLFPEVVAVNQQVAPEDRRTSEWQTKLLPFMIGMVIVLTITFFAASFVQLGRIQDWVDDTPSLEMDPVFAVWNGEDRVGNVSLDYVRWETSVRLEAHALSRRYRQADIFLMAAIWIKYLGFVTGMILALVGATFVLGKLQTEMSEISAEGKGVKGLVRSSSPGIVLASLGTVLMFTAIIGRSNYTVNDRPLYASSIPMYFEVLRDSTSGAVISRFLGDWEAETRADSLRADSSEARDRLLDSVFGTQGQD